MFRSCLRGKRCSPKKKSPPNLAMNIISTHIVPKKPRTIENIRQIAIMALLSREFRNEYLPELRKLKTQKNLSNYLNSLNYSMFRRGEYRPRSYKPNTGRLEVGYPKPYIAARKLVRANSVFSTKRTRNLSKRMNQRNNAINAIKRAPKQIISKSIGRGRTNITFKTLPNGKVYTWGSNKTLNGLNLGVPYKNVKLRSIFTKTNRKR